MKKLVFGIIATIAFSFSGFSANHVNLNEISNDEVKPPCTVVVKEVRDGITYSSKCTRVTCDNAYACASALNKQKRTQSFASID